MKTSRPPPGPRGLPLLGHLPRFWRDRLGFLVRCAREYGDVVSLRLGRPSLLLTHPDDIRHVLVTRAERYAKVLRISGELGRRRLGESVLTSSGDAHLKQRRALQPTMHAKALAVFAGTIMDAADAWMSARRHEERLDIAAEMRTLAQRIMTIVLLGDVQDEGGSLARAISARRRFHEYVVGGTLPRFQPSRVPFEYRRAIGTLDTVLTRAIEARRRTRATADDMLSRWIRARYDDGTGMTDAQLRAEALTFIDTGFETIAATLTWTWYLLATHPHADTKLTIELRDVLGGRRPEAGDLSRLRYARAIVRESLRLYPPAWNFVRTALQPDVLPSGAEVAPGTKLFLCQYVVHRDPRHFPKPDEFRPERFESDENPNGPRFSYFPFGGGPHTCLGEAFAELETILVLASLARRFRFDLVPGRRVRFDARFALRPRDGLWVDVVAR